MKACIFTTLSVFIFFTACTQNKIPGTDKKVGGDCEGCEAIFESKVSFDQIGWEANLPGYNSNGPKLHLSGTVYKPDGKTPAPGVIIYVYHTDQQGVYPTKGDEKGWDKRHGYIRGWAKTNADGRYTFHTLKPAPYPGTRGPAHIHITIKEEGKTAYWVDEIVFEGETPAGHHEEKRGGRGLIQLSKSNNAYYGKRDIILGMNIPGYD